ncbi:hypothetical protein VE00_09793 [Pseudogymnoascus sp. WSF 3629]|nr:hypothetical protein VE00_09793 [Pseudogymnoascus sp. WSF 3629]
MEAAFRRAEEKERQEIKEADEHREPNPWLRRMPDEDEPELQTVCKAFDWMIREAQYITVQEVVGQAALFEVHRKEVTQEARMPFDSWMDITTVRSYTQIWRQLLCYVFRAEGEEPEDQLAYQLTERQKISMRGLQAVVQEFQSWKNEQSLVVSGVGGGWVGHGPRRGGD